MYRQCSRMFRGSLEDTDFRKEGSEKETPVGLESGTGNINRHSVP